MAASEDTRLLARKNGDDVATRRVDMPHIQGLRFIAMTWIIFFHYLGGSLVGDEGTVVSNLVGHRPLDLFTVISGFATHLAYGHYKRRLGTPIQFLARRASRLVFTYYLTLNIAFFLKLISLGATQPTMAEVRVKCMHCAVTVDVSSKTHTFPNFSVWARAP